MLSFKPNNKFNAFGLGLDALKEAFTVGKVAIIVSGRFGHEEAVRTVIRMQRLESGFVYKQQK